MKQYIGLKKDNFVIYDAWQDDFKKWNTDVFLDMDVLLDYCKNSATEKTENKNKEMDSVESTPLLIITNKQASDKPQMSSVCISFRY